MARRGRAGVMVTEKRLPFAVARLPGLSAR